MAWLKREMGGDGGVRGEDGGRKRERELYLVN